MMVEMKVLYSFNENVGTTGDCLLPATFVLLDPSNPESNAGRLEHVKTYFQLSLPICEDERTHGLRTHPWSF